MRLRALSILVLGFVLPLLAVSAYADTSPILGPNLSTFAVLGASTVTNVPTSTITGSVGVWSSGGANAITGFNSSPGVAVSDSQVTAGTVQAGTTTAMLAQGELTTALGYLGGLSSIATTITGGNLSGQNLAPGVYSVGAASTNLAGGVPNELTLNGGGNANATWVFLMSSTLITSPGAVVNVINVGSGTGNVFWDVGSSATIDTTTAFYGNILALASISMNTDATDSCGGLYASTAAVTLQMNTISTGCAGGLTVTTGGGGTVVGGGGIPNTRVPEPGTLALLSSGLLGMVFLAFRKPRVSSLSC